jgi:cytochrome c oxidase cbb3-type subunit II
MSEPKKAHKIELSAILTVIGIIVLFSASVFTILIAPVFIDSTWTSPTTPYQVQMYEISDPNLYISSTGQGERQIVHHLRENFTLIAIKESELQRFIAPPELEKFITKYGEKKLKLTSKLLMLRPLNDSPETTKEAQDLRQQLEKEWKQRNPNAEKEELYSPAFTILELYAPGTDSAFSVSITDGILENWVDPGSYEILDNPIKQPYHNDPGVIYILNPQEYKISLSRYGNEEYWHYDATGKKIVSLQELKSHPLGFLSREELIKTGEHIYAIEGCWYCHTDQTRTLIQDVVLNGSDSYPAPPSSANEYIYQRITFPGTRRIGPDLSRVGVKRQSRDWHKGHFWSPKTASPGSIMPAFKHFFDNDPRGTAPNTIGIPNYQFEAIFQYLMTKGTRITPPTQAWWLGKDPIKTKEIIEGMRVLP